MPPANLILRRWLVFGCYALAVLALSVAPERAVQAAPSLFPHQDKVLHGLMYAGWVALFLRALPERLRRNGAVLACAVALAACYGGLMEVIQGACECLHRDFSWADMLANLAGAIIGTIFSFRVR